MEGFISKSLAIDCVADEEFLLHRYPNTEYIMNLEFEYGVEFINQAYDKALEERLFKQWLVEIPHMKKSVSFEDYKRERLRPRINITKRLSKEEWLIKAQEIEQKTKRGDF